MGSKRKSTKPKMATPVDESPRVEQAQPEQPRSRYEDTDLDQQDESIYLPPHLNLEGMTKEQISATSMRYLGHRPPTNATKEAAIAQVRREMRAGLPGHGRSR